MGSFVRLRLFANLPESARDKLLLAIYLVVSAALLTNFDFHLLVPEQYGLVFNDMAERLLHWDFTIDPKLIGSEGFVVGRHVYTYFGIFPALLRIPLVLFGGRDIVVARISCLAALAVFVWANIRIARTIAAAGPEEKRKTGLVAIWIAALLFSGPQIYLLSSAWIFHEPEFWAGALAAAFNYIALQSYVRGEWPRGKGLAALAMLAALALLTRVPTGAGLYVAAGGFILGARRAGNRHRRDVWIAAAISAAGLIAACGVNQARWGDPLVFAPLEKQINLAASPHEEQTLHQQGAFQPSRIPFGILYYLTGLPMKDHFAGFMDRNYALVEGPRIPILLASPIAFLLAAQGVMAMIRARSRMAVPIILVAGQGLTALLVLGFMWLTLRYTIDLWGVIAVAAAIGLQFLLLRRRSPALHGLMIVLALVGILVSSLTLVRYKLTTDGVSSSVRFTLSRKVRPLVCPHARASGTQDNNPPLITPSCPPFW